MKHSVLTLFLLSAAVALSSQEPTPRFEVASVKFQHRNAVKIGKGLAPGLRILPGGRFEADQVTVEQLVWLAYEDNHALREYQFLGLPEWARANPPGSVDKFAISAKAAYDASPDKIKLMVRSLLEDRFKMVTHLESRELRYQALVTARADGALGPKLFRMDEECSPQVASELAKRFPEKYSRGPGAGDGITYCSAAGVEALADFLAGRLGTPVFDATGLKGSYYFLLTATLPKARPIGLGLPMSDSSELPALSTALRDQLGLKLESRKGPLPVLVVDSIEHPSEN